MRKSLLEWAISCQVIQFGDFKLKSGRMSPYFFNAGKLLSGQALRAFSEAYAELIRETFPQVRTIFGPAYKGIPLASTTATALSDLGCDVQVCFDRKETKDHGEGGNLIGELIGPVVIVDDVITKGVALAEALARMPKDIEVAGLVVAFDREEVGEQTGATSRQQLAEKHGIKIESLISFSDLFSEITLDSETEQALRAYREEYGV